jgi:hypothetical protein
MAVACGVVLLLLSSWASAKGLSVYAQCEPAPLMSVPDSEPEVLVSELPDDAEAEDCDGLIIERSGQVPVCLLEGASAVADRPIQEVDGTAIEAGPRQCMELEAPDQVRAPSDDRPTEPPQATPRATTPAPVVVPDLPSPLIGELLRPVRLVYATTGHERGVYRPPRG